MHLRILRDIPLSSNSTLSFHFGHKSREMTSLSHNSFSHTCMMVIIITCRFAWFMGVRPNAPLSWLLYVTLSLTPFQGHAQLPQLQPWKISIDTISYPKLRHRKLSTWDIRPFHVKGAIAFGVNLRHSQLKFLICNLRISLVDSALYYCSKYEFIYELCNNLDVTFAWMET